MTPASDLRGSAGRASRDGGNAPHWRCFDFSISSSGFHVGRHSMLAAIGLHTYTDVQWNVTTSGSYLWLVRQTEWLPHPRPAFGFGADLRIPIPRCLPQVLASKLKLSSGTPGAEFAPRASYPYRQEASGTQRGRKPVRQWRHWRICVSVALIPHGLRR
jgi:hypothetical protein